LHPQYYALKDGKLNPIAIKDYIRTRNASGRSFKWVKKPEDVLAKIQKAKTETVMQDV
jgi:hypothetical protein